MTLALVNMSGGKIPRAFIDDLLVRADIVDLIGQHLPLKKNGANFIARCPFHNEKTPSFSVSRNKQFFYCFGCHESGNAISFLMKFSHLGFVEAVEDLAGFVGVEVPREEAPDAKTAQDAARLKDLYGLMAAVAGYYAQGLLSQAAGKVAVAYLKKRQISRESVSAYWLGYAPQDGRELLARFDQQALLESGLVGQSEQGEIYPRFRNRVMFPIRDKRGRVIGFGGRVLDNSLPKYLNSPETVLFHKSREVYGLYELLARDAKPARILLVEGYMDVIALAQQGIGYAVAALGTAVSQAHLDLLFRFTSEIVFCFDGDSAGREAAWKAAEVALPVLRDGRQIRVLLLPQGHDPDSWVQAQGMAGFVESLEASQALSDYFFGQLAQDANLAETEGRARFVNQAGMYLAKLPDGVYKDMMFARLAEQAKTSVSKQEPLSRATQASTSWTPKDSRPTLERYALALLVHHPQLIETVDVEDDWQSLRFKGADNFKAIVETVFKGRPATTGALLEHCRGGLNEQIVQKLLAMPLEVPPEGVEAEFRGAWKRLLQQSLEAHFDALLAKMQAQGLTQEEQATFKKLSIQLKTK